MPQTLSNGVQRALPVRTETVAKAGLSRLGNPEMDAEAFRVMLGAAVKRARLRCDWSLKELAVALNKDERQVGKWESGHERPHFDLLFALQGPYRRELVIALAELGGDDIDIETTVRVRTARV